MTFDAKVIVGFTSELGLSTTRFQNTLRKGNGSRNAVLSHFFNGNVFESLYVSVVISLGFRRGVDTQEKYQEKNGRIVF
jgi:hypothetical protein